MIDLMAAGRALIDAMHDRRRRHARQWDTPEVSTHPRRTRRRKATNARGRSSHGKPPPHCGKPIQGWPSQFRPIRWDMPCEKKNSRCLTNNNDVNSKSNPVWMSTPQIPGGTVRSASILLR